MKALKLNVLICLICLNAAAVWAQDTILQRIEKLSPDTAKANRLIEHGRYLFGKDNESAMRVLARGLKLSQDLQYNRGIGLAYRRIGYIHGQEGSYRSAIENYFLSLDHLNKSSNSLPDILAVYNNIASNLRQLGKIDSAITYYIEGIRKVEALDPREHNVMTWRDIQGSYALLNSNLSSLYGAMKNVSKAIEYGFKGVEASKQIKDTGRMILSLASIAHAYEIEKDFKKVLYYSGLGVQLARKINDPIALSKSLHLLSVSYTSTGKTDSAILVAREAMEAAKEFDKQLYITAFLDLADAYHEKKDFKKEERVLLQGLSELEKLGNLAFYGMNFYEKLANNKYAQGDYKAAFDYYDQSIVYKDSMLRIENREIVAQMESQYQASQKEKFIAEQQVELQKKQNFIYYSLKGLVVAILLAAFFYIRAKFRKRIHENDLKTERQHKEIQLLQALMKGEEQERSRIAKDLHDGVAGMLAAVKMQLSSSPLRENSLNNEAFMKGIELLDEATIEIRKTSHNLMPEVLLSHGLDMALRRYCNNISSQKLTIQYDSWGDFKRYASGFELSVYRMVQELLNNVLKHSKASKALVQMSLQQEVLSITVEDDGIGFENLEKYDGIGFESIKRRVSAMNGTVHLDSVPGQGFSAYLEFDVNSSSIFSSE